MNHLKFESSPYLKQHENNPVDWYAWNDQTLRWAQKLDKPILLSIGYSTCHWCHVMEKESFMDCDIADYMNHHFVNIKIDREERPDLDSIYMDACQEISGKSGWPLHVFLTPERKPFFAGTYFPTEPRRGLMSWTQALQYVVYNFLENRQAVEVQADRILGKLSNQDEFSPTKNQAKDKHVISQQLKEGFLKKADSDAGGFGKAAKYPSIEALEFLLIYAKYHPEGETLEFVETSVDKMGRGGIYDQLGGGIFRYTIDRFWRIPHFEKMLYDNAEFISLLADCYKFSGKVTYLNYLQASVDFVRKELMNEQGGFYAGIDADSEGIEGKYYTWNKSEFQNVLGEHASLFSAYYGVVEEGNWEGTNILWIPKKRNEFLVQQKMKEEIFSTILTEARLKLRMIKENRVPPFVDKKIILGWNALMISAMTKCYTAIGNPEYKHQCLKSILFLKSNFINDQNELGHYQINGQSHGKASLTDYSLFIKACLDVFQISFDNLWLDLACQLTERVLSRFSDSESPFLYETGIDQVDLIYRKKELKDNDHASSNAVMAWNLETLGILLGRLEWLDQCQYMLENIQGTVMADPLSYAFWAQQLYLQEIGRLEIAVLGKEAIPLANKINHTFLPGKVLIASTKPNDLLPLLAHRWDKDKTQIFLCHNFACQRPVETIEEFKKLVKEKVGFRI